MGDDAQPRLEPCNKAHGSGKAKLVKAIHYFNRLIGLYQMIIAAFCRIKSGTKSEV